MVIIGYIVLVRFGIVSTLLYYNIKYILNDYEYKKENDYIFLKGDISGIMKL